MNLSSLVETAFSSILQEEPFTHIAFHMSPLPHQHAYSMWAYWIAVMLGSPFFSIGSSLFLSLVTNEWWEVKSFRREFEVSLRSVALASPFIALFLKLAFDGSVGFVYYENDNYPFLYTYVVAPILYLIISDAYFYWTHRFWHLPWMYSNSHYIHHTCRPSTTFSGTSADAFEIVISGHGSTLAPALFVPINSQVYLFMVIVTELWTMYLHNYKASKLPPMINDSFNHNIHHYYGQANYNFSLYFEFWDRVMGTYKGGVSSSKRLGGVGENEERENADRLLKDVRGKSGVTIK